MINQPIGGIVQRNATRTFHTMTATAKNVLGDRFVSLTDGASHPGPQQIALVPGAEVPVLTLDLPAGLRGQSREKVARRQLLDRAGLGADQTQMRPLHLPRQKDSWSRVMVADSAQLNSWKTLAGTACRAMLPDYLALPTSDEIWTVCTRGNDVLARLGPDDGFTAPAEVAVNLLRLQADRALPKALLTMGEPNPQIAALADEFELKVITDPTQAKALQLAEPKVLAHGELSFDLRRDPQLARSRLRSRVLPWRWPVLFGLIALGLWGATTWIETGRVQARTEGINAQSRALVREHFVPSGPLLDLRVQVSQALAERRVSSTDWRAEVTALDLFASASGVLNAAGVQTETVSAISPQELALTLKVADFAAVDALGAALRAAGLEVDVVESRVSEGSSDVRTEIRLTPPETEAGQ